MSKQNLGNIREEIFKILFPYTEPKPNEMVEQIYTLIEEARKWRGEIILLQLVESLGYEMSKGYILQARERICEANFENFMRLVEQRIEGAEKKLDEWQAGFEHFLSLNLELTQKIVEGAKKQERIAIGNWIELNYGRKQMASIIERLRTGQALQELEEG